MILPVADCVKAIFEEGRAYPWSKPRVCPRCGCCRIWGHGFVRAYFDDLPGFVWLRRYRCPECGLTIRLRPRAYWSRFQASIATIRESLRRRLEYGRWLAHLPRPRQRHWFRGLRTQLLLHLGLSWSGSLIAAFDWLAGRGIAAASRSACRATPAAPG